MKTIAYTDGATYRTNPGPGGIGVAAYEDLVGSGMRVSKSRRPDWTVCEPIGFCTNNEAEYRAIVTAIEYWILEHCDNDHTMLEIRSDSELVVKQIKGFYMVRDAKLKPWHEQIKLLRRAIRKAGGKFKIKWIPRNDNKMADELSKAAATLNGVGDEEARLPEES